jgi:hypothetical protein
LPELGLAFLLAAASLILDVTDVFLVSFSHRPHSEARSYNLKSKRMFDTLTGSIRVFRSEACDFECLSEARKARTPLCCIGRYGGAWTSIGGVEKRRLALSAASLGLDVPLQVKLTIVAVFQESSQPVFERAELRSGSIPCVIVRSQVNRVRYALDGLSRFANRGRLGGGLLDAFGGELVAPLTVYAEDLHSYSVMLLEVVIDVSDEGVGYFGDVNQTGLASGQSDDRTVLGKLDYGPVYGVADLKGHAV